MNVDVTEMKLTDWKWMPASEIKDKQFWPNRIAWNNDAVFVIEIRRSKGNDFALSSRVLSRAKEQLAAGKIKEIFVRLAERNGTFVKQATLKNVQKVVENQEPIEGNYGSYWWLNEKLELPTCNETF